eukprot:CAMPEP_0170489238 /NCGR_PEP_ID=MMETSP0208-20121228/7625_1 /TAXON_ID=197538 /ORGANISM="Strombidium inclinatum, Strain S3" /LENGTH=70 /DNA_ID=CAMNT_0010764079 /DNA_START=69 /DNA_END=277 /DNA_ORIENTATION=-
MTQKMKNRQAYDLESAGGLGVFLFYKQKETWAVQFDNDTAVREVDYDEEGWRHNHHYVLEEDTQLKMDKL